MSIRRILTSLLLCLLAGFFPLLALWRNNLGQIDPAVAVPSLLYTLVFILLVFGGWLLLARLPEKAALLSCVTLGFVFSFGHLANLLGNVVILGVSIGILKLFLAAFLLLAGACFLILRLRQVPNPSLLLIPAGALVLLNLVPILRFSIQARQLAPAVVDGLSNQAISNTTGKDELPDIYYIVLDAYARDDILQKVIGYDNSAFLEALRARGFYIPECAYSNYSGTVWSIAATLNYDMLDALGAQLSDHGAIQGVDSSLIHNNRASQVFRSFGYQFVTGRGYASFNDITSADVYLNYAIEAGIEDNLAAQRFTSLYLNTTLFRVVSALYQNNPEWFARLPFWLAVDRDSDSDLEEATFWYFQNNYMFDELAAFPARPGAYFVYAHINAPHGPYVYRRDGSFRYPLDDGEEPERYADAIDYINRRVLALVDALQNGSGLDPIIILQGDHGIHNMTSGLDKHKILSAYYLPGDLSTPPYPTITPVNNFRLILRNYFDPSVPLLPDTLWVKRLNDFEPTPAQCP